MLLARHTEAPPWRPGLRPTPVTRLRLVMADLYLIYWHKWVSLGNNKVSVQLENFFRWNPSGTFRNIPWHHWNNPKKVPGAPSQGFLKFLVFVKNVTKFKNWLSRPHFLANFQLSYHFGKLLTVRSQGFTASKNLSLHQ